MTAAFADTFYWVALTNPHDSAHQRVLDVSRSQELTLVTTDQVLTEYLNFFAKRGQRLREAASANARAILMSRQVECVRHNRQSLLDGLNFYESRVDKGYSLTDCVSMVVMRRRGIGVALTNDHSFYAGRI